MLAESKFAKESFFPPKKSLIVGGDNAAAPNGSEFCLTGGVFKTENGDGFDKLTDGADDIGGGDVSEDDDDVDARSDNAEGGVILIEDIDGGVAVAVGFAIAAVAGGVVLLCISNVEPISPDENFDGGEWSGPFGVFSGSGSTVCLT